MKTHIVSYVMGVILLAMAITAIAEETKLKPLNEKEYQTLIEDLDRGKDCIFSGTVNNWVVLDDRRFIFYVPTKNKPYFIKLTIRSHELKYALRIGIRAKFDDRLCPYGGNALFIDGTRYTIQSIKKLDKNTAKQLIAYQKDMQVAKKAEK